MVAILRKIGLPAERCRELFDLARRNKSAVKQLSTATFGYFEAFAAAGMQENETEGQLRIAIPCSPVTRRGFLKAIEQGLGHKPTVEEILAPLLEGGKLNEETIAAIRLDVESLMRPTTTKEGGDGKEKEEGVRRRVESARSPCHARMRPHPREALNAIRELPAPVPSGMAARSLLSASSRRMSPQPGRAPNAFAG